MHNPNCGCAMGGNARQRTTEWCSTVSASESAATPGAGGLPSPGQPPLPWRHASQYMARFVAAKGHLRSTRSKKPWLTYDLPSPSKLMYVT